ncbi:class I SAM-dependent methyltransferase [Pontibacter sp. CAU 1760]
MDPQKAYRIWAAQYDTNLNKTRDLEAEALRTELAEVKFGNCLEIGCGTGKNTVWLVERAKQLTAVDLTEEMLAKAKERLPLHNIRFIQADITHPWTFGKNAYDLVSFSLVMEHIQHLDPVFEETAKALRSGGHAYIGELHPFKQYTGTKARFETGAGQQIVACYTHNLSDFVQAAKRYGLEVVTVNEYFDNHDRTQIPRILTLLLQKV